MSEENGEELPNGWVKAALSEICRINPPLDRCILSDDIEVGFVPMRAVEPEGRGLLRPEVTTYGKVKKGYTAFISGDVIMAKITPCMENGKTCVVPELPGAACFGSTEFHVVRSESSIPPRWIANFLLQHSTRHEAQRQMMGGVGQMRVPSGFLETLHLPIPPLAEQTRIADKLDELLSDLDAGVAALAGARAKLKHYRAAVLKAAVEGALTADLPCRQAGWRDPKFRNCSGSRVPENSDAFFAYVLECEDGSLYKGFCQNLWARIDRHLDGRGAEWTSKHKPVALVHFEKFDTMAEAREREVYFKSGSGREWLAALWKERKPATESAADLLTRILAERRRRWEEAQLQKFKEQGKAPPKNWPACRTGRKAKYQEPSAPDTTHLPELPDGWCWAKLDQVAAIAGGVTKGQKFSEKAETREVPYLRVANVQRGYLDLLEIKTIRALAAEVKELALRPGDVLFNEGGDRDKLGRGWIWEGQIEECVHQNHVFRARLFLDEMQPKLVSWCGNSYGQQWFMKAGKQSVNLASINLTVLRSFPVPLPPLAEQTAIVELVEDQLSVIDHLEADLDAKLKSAQALRQSILRSAFEGRLVPQDPNDEPASELLKRIAAEREARAKLAKATKRPRAVGETARSSRSRKP